MNFFQTLIKWKYELLWNTNKIETDLSRRPVDLQSTGSTSKKMKFLHFDSLAVRAKNRTLFATG